MLSPTHSSDVPRPRISRCSSYTFILNLFHVFRRANLFFLWTLGKAPGLLQTTLMMHESCSTHIHVGMGNGWKDPKQMFKRWCWLEEKFLKSMPKGRRNREWARSNCSTDYESRFEAANEIVRLYEEALTFPFSSFEFSTFELWTLSSWAWDSHFSNMDFGPLPYLVIPRVSKGSLYWKVYRRKTHF